ncbi:hypothetical protein FO615_05615 [Riemerella anatipestifer]|uniref:hypothetical protein n=1 Tax=Riemerella anatipestifer TaxID=34085 RepID=UPI0023634588|nr:hypothetical protein [Riemerella anatipestifer]MDD1553053.1 hypothetical protein [Riemerella anatipestifer]MDD1594931.1 hypothetical protein [Riemerella anatipestifer]MDY3334533.1 hypothetical protein [Riemerella anatipestifer]MDY3380528.1 hypothetical protein [Riemerella anatipestifer]MDY3384703.1 hypothetical protein [Riemerella anatipestifer]
MKSILNNPFRIAGILANASAREILARKNRISAYAKVGKKITSEYDFSFLNSIQRTNGIIDKAFSDIEQNQNKVVHSLFWFTNLNPVDNTAIQHLVSGNKEKAIEIWDKLTDEKEVTSKNFSAFNNIGTLYLLEASKQEIKKGIAAKIKLIESESFQDFVHTVADETFSIDKNKQIEIFIDELLTQFKDKYSTSETMELFSNCNGTTQKYLSKKFTEEPIHKIETQIEQCTKKRANDKINAYKYATDLYNNTKSELALLKSIVGNTNLQYKMLADNIAKEVLQYSIDYFNESQEQEKSSDYLEKAMKLAKVAESIAANDATKNKVKENISTLEEMKDREIDQAIEVLQSVKDAYEKIYNELVEKAKEQIYGKSKTIKTPSGEMKIPINISEKTFDIYNMKSINYDTVKEIARKSINKDVATNLINKTLTEQRLKKISESEKTEKIQEFYKLLCKVNDEIINIEINKIEQILLKYLSKSHIVYQEIKERKKVNFKKKTELPEWVYSIGFLSIILLVVYLIWDFEVVKFVLYFLGFSFVIMFFNNLNNGK